MSIGKLTAIRAQPGHAIELTWDDGFAARLDLTKLVQSRGVLAPLREEGAYAEAKLSAGGWSMEWPSGIDFGAPQLRRWAIKGFDDRAAA